MKQTGTIAARQLRAPSLVSGALERLGRGVKYGALTIETPSGDRSEFIGSEPLPGAAVWKLNNWKPLWALATRGAMGLAESYLAGDWDSPDLAGFLYFGSVNERSFGDSTKGVAALRLGDRLRHLLRSNSPSRARRNIAYHYDLGNDFYASWLDRSMTYSSALFEGDNDSLELAQQRKYARLADVAGLDAGVHALEIGCGWGGFMEYAAVERGARITGVSISAEQCDYARARLARTTASAQAAVEFCDYRQLEGQYKHIVSIEMFEAVGEAYWPTYAAKLKSLLAPGGRVALQTITIEQARFEGYRRSPDFIQRYVFPGGMLPTKAALASTLSEAGLKITDRLDFGHDYARTLVEWRERFDASWPAIAKLGFDDRFRRLWHYYLAYCEAGFRDNAVDVVQVGIEHDR
jgi:cyclopropane-fatty-acyl-phospholipid synthase